MVKVSVIVPYKVMNIEVKRCRYFCEEFLPEAELIFVSDEDCPGLPSSKRNWAMQRAKGDIFAFLDSDAFPSPGWIKNALYWLQCFPAVCGPGVLPPEDGFGMQMVADKVHQWVFAPWRVKAMKPRLVPWHPTFNLIVKREVATRFDPYLTGEDDKFGLRIPGGIWYHPDILVYHSRRPAFKLLWRQFGQWGRTKGHFKRLALIAWVTTLWVYITNWIKGFLRGKI